MADYAPPSGPPPPKVPEGWKAVWNNEYKEWFYVNLQTKTSQWDPPHDPSSITPANAPPSYTGGGGGIPQYAEKGSNNPYNNPNTDSDAAYAARLQAEEDERARHDSRGAADGYYQQQQPQGQGPQPGGMMGGYPGAPGQYDQHELPPREQKSKGLGGLLSKLSGKVPGGGGSHGGGIGGFSQGHGGGYGQQQPYGGGGYPQQQGYGGGGYGGGGYGMPPKKHGGMGMAGAGALGLGGGLVGGALIGNAMGGDDGGGDYGGGDGGYGGDDGGYGGVDGGGDFGGGDGGGGGD